MPPPCAQEIDIHVIDLAQMQEVGKILRSHVAYSPFNECFFISLDVCNEFVARYKFLLCTFLMLGLSFTIILFVPLPLFNL